RCAPACGETARPIFFSRSKTLRADVSFNPGKLKANAKAEWGFLAAALWPRAGIVKGAAASPLNTFA
ncbi:hypothetical protein ACUU3S_003079, partial [Cronobacter dublinensis]